MSQKQTSVSKDSLIERFREECLKRGASGIKNRLRKLRTHSLTLKLKGIKSIGRLWVQLDDNHSGDLSFAEFENGILNHNIKLSRNEIASLFKEVSKTTVIYDYVDH